MDRSETVVEEEGIAMAFVMEEEGIVMVFVMEEEGIVVMDALTIRGTREVIMEVVVLDSPGRNRDGAIGKGLTMTGIGVV